MKKRPAFVIAAARSGSGKTTLTLGIVAALIDRGLDVRCFKCGPDFIDPTLHRLITSKNSYNLDLNMMGADCCTRTFAEKSAGGDVSVVEGVMGLFDGGSASTAALAKALDLPVLLIIDAGSMAESGAAILKGFTGFDRELDIAGVIFNRIGSQRHRQLIEDAVRQHCSISYCEFFGRDQRHRIPERHLGLHMGSENPLGSEGQEQLVKAVESQLDLDSLLEAVSRHEQRKTFKAPVKTVPFPGKNSAKLRLGVAFDEAFSFYYPQNLELFEEYGFEIVRFSPLNDRVVPNNVDMLYFGGGYPELHAARLSDNRSMRRSILDHHSRSQPIYGECGGFMYLCRSLADMDGVSHEMVGIFLCDTSMNKRLRRLGYRRATLQLDCLLGSKGDTLYGHEFHYSDIVGDSDGLTAEEEKAALYKLDNSSHEGYSAGAALGSYVHLHFGKTVSVIDRIHDLLSSKKNRDT